MAPASSAIYTSTAAPRPAPPVLPAPQPPTPDMTARTSARPSLSRFRFRFCCSSRVLPRPASLSEPRSPRRIASRTGSGRVSGPIGSDRPECLNASRARGIGTVINLAGGVGRGRHANASEQSGAVPPVYVSPQPPRAPSEGHAEKLASGYRQGRLGEASGYACNKRQLGPAYPCCASRRACRPAGRDTNLPSSLPGSPGSLCAMCTGHTTHTTPHATHAVRKTAENKDSPPAILTESMLEGRTVARPG